MDAELKEYIDAKFAEPAGLVKQATPLLPENDPEDMTTSQAMVFMNYTDRDAFLVAVRRDRIPFIRVNKRRFLFPVAAMRSWKATRTRNPVSI